MNWSIGDKQWILSLTRSFDAGVRAYANSWWSSWLSWISKILLCAKKRMNRFTKPTLDGGICRAETNSRRVMGFPWLDIMSGIPSSQAHIRHTGLRLPNICMYKRFWPSKNSMAFWLSITTASDIYLIVEFALFPSPAFAWFI